jgi:hypothetical protein
MATVTKKTSPPPPPRPGSSSALGLVVRVADAIYRFLASLKLAVISLGTLAAVLAYATFFESWYGASAVQEWIYRSKGFAILLAFLGANILCAALIRYPWKKRQIGFLITHAGLLVLLAGSLRSVYTADEGQVGMLEGDVKNQLVRIDYPVIRVRPLDPKTHEPTREYELPFRPGNFAWGPGQPRPRGFFGTLAHAVTFGAFDEGTDKGEVLTESGDPFQLTVKNHLPASAFAVALEADPNGTPMALIRVKAKPPAMPTPIDVFQGEGRLFETDKRMYRVSKSRGSGEMGFMPATISFLYVDRPELVEDFLNPPKDPGHDGVARIRYRDKAGKDRVYDWKLDGQDDRTVELPDSDLTVRYTGSADIPTEGTTLGRALGDLYRGPEGETTVPVANFKVRKGSGPEVVHHGWAMLPMLPNVIPSENRTAEPLVAIEYYLPPVLDPKANGKFGVVEILGTPKGTLHYRVFGRPEAGQGRAVVRSSGRVEKGKEVVAFGGNPNLPMTLSFQVDDYLPSAREREFWEPIVMPKGKQGEGLAASLVAMTVDGHTEEFWIRRSATLDPLFQKVSFPSGEYEVAYDVDRKPLGFSLKLDDFDVGFDPGTEQASSYVSKVRLTDEAMGIKDEPHTIQMNEPLTHRGYTFYQSSYVRHRDPRTMREDGQFMSIFQVGIDPGRMTKYLGCLMVVLGAFVQFYMRAGIFTDGGKRERARAEAKARKRAGLNGAPETTVAVVNESEETL